MKPESPRSTKSAKAPSPKSGWFRWLTWTSRTDAAPDESRLTAGKAALHKHFSDCNNMQLQLIGAKIQSANNWTELIHLRAKGYELLARSDCEQKAMLMLRDFEMSKTDHN